MIVMLPTYNRECQELLVCYVINVTYCSRFLCVINITLFAVLTVTGIIAMCMMLCSVLNVYTISARTDVFVCATL